jgi:hypothetical protein
MFNSFVFGNIYCNKTIDDRSDYIMITTFVLLGGAFTIAAGLNFFAVNDENAFIDDEAIN